MADLGPEGPNPLARFGRFELLRRVSVGGMAEVFQAKAFGPDGFENIVALKRLLPIAEEEAERVAMLSSEAKVAMQLDHPRIATVYEFGQVGDSHYIAMEFLDGRDLGALIRRSDGPFPPEFVAALGAQVADALAYAHGFVGLDRRALKIVHRDISPANIMVNAAGLAVVIDFGIATFNGRDIQTQAGVLKGKNAYMSPEQVRGESLDARSDIFALGAILHELASGRRLFRRESAIGTFEAVQAAEIPPLLPGFPHPIEAAIRRCLERDPNARWADAAALCDVLTGWLGDQAAESSGSPGPLEAPIAAVYDALLGDETSADAGPTIAGYRGNLRSAEDRGAETTDQGQVADATLVFAPDDTDLRTYMERLRAGAPPAESTPATGDASRARIAPAKKIGMGIAWAMALGSLAFALVATAWYLQHILQ